MSGGRRLARARVAGVLVAGLSLSLVGGLLVAPTAQAASTSDLKAKKKALDKKLAGIQEDLEGANKDLVAAALTLEKAKSQLADAEAELSAAQAALATAKKRDAEIAQRLAVAQAAVAKAQRDLDAREAEESDSRAVIGTIAREAYVNSGMSSLSIVLNATSPQQFADQMSAAGTALRSQNSTVDRLEVQQAETRAKRAKLDAAADVVQELKVQSEAVVAVREAAETKASAAQAAVAKIVATRQSAVNTIAQRKKAEQKRLAEVTKQQHKITNLLRAKAGKGPAYLDGNGKLSHPVTAPITSGYGLRYHPILHYYRLHAGTDFGAPCGTPVHAPAAGRIVRAGWVGGFGNQILIDHGRVNGKSLASSVNHLSRITKHSGHVSRGQLIGYSGTTGLSTGCHLHFEVYVNGSTVNPMKWL
ncbi:peptidoglycan DD-metalloendopeptidase family protein [Spongisporangium articulatum]|uniref:Peptidoglycan DD-metalloendopeptidase family protein n=1 Tax=Spongisporangium articulatum TaxID=3362603 RepID=A0ABW8AK23_9ACTN